MRSALLALLLFIGGFCSAQNLVPNPSFEDTVECPDFPGQVWRAEGWYIAENTPDYYNCCSNQTFPICGVPQNQFSYRNAASGNAYCGIYTYLNFPPLDFQEKIGVELSSPLQIGMWYYVSAKLSSISTNNNQVSNGAHNKLGFLFSNSRYDMSNRPPNDNYAHFFSDSIVSDTVGWYTIKGMFLADSTYRFLTIGNFFDNLHVDTLRYWYINGNNGLTSYYFIDDICVTTDSIYCDFSSFNQGFCNFTGVPSLAQNPTKSLLYPNPASSFFQVETAFDQIGLLEIYSPSGEVMLKQKIPIGRYTSSINISEFKNGFFWIKITDDNKFSYQKLIVQH